MDQMCGGVYELFRTDVLSQSCCNSNVDQKPGSQKVVGGGIFRSTQDDAASLAFGKNSEGSQDKCRKAGGDTFHAGGVDSLSGGLWVNFRATTKSQSVAKNMLQSGFRHPKSGALDFESGLENFATGAGYTDFRCQTPDS